ncbi:MAG: hypothetical protein WBM27_07280 [bacterium]
MKRKQLLIGVFVLLVIGVLLRVVCKLFLLIAAWFKSLDPAIAGAVVTAVIGLVGLWYAQWQSKSRDIAESHRPSKIEVYNTFFNIVERFLEESTIPGSEAATDPPEWAKKEIIKLNRGLILWSSPRVISAWIKFRTAAASGENILVAADRMYQAIRSDLGHSNLGLKSGDLIRINLKDPNEWKS